MLDAREFSSHSFFIGAAIKQVKPYFGNGQENWALGIKTDTGCNLIDAGWLC